MDEDMKKILGGVKSLLEGLKAWWNKEEDAVPIEPNDPIITDPPPEPEPEIEAPNVAGPLWKNNKVNTFTDVDGLVIDGFEVNNVDIALKFKGINRGVKVLNSKGQDVTKFVHVDYEHGAEVHDFEMDTIEVFNFRKSVADIAPNSSNILMKNIIGDANFNRSGNFVMCIHIRENCKNSSIFDAVLSNIVYYENSWKPKLYQNNGDGIVYEGGCTNIVIVRPIITFSTQSGIDSKSAFTLIDGRITLCRQAIKTWATDKPYIFKGLNVFKQCNAQDMFAKLIQIYPDLEAKTTKVSGGAGIWAKRKEVKFEGIETKYADGKKSIVPGGNIQLIDTSTTIRID